MRPHLSTVLTDDVLINDLLNQPSEARSVLSHLLISVSPPVVTRQATVSFQKSHNMSGCSWQCFFFFLEMRSILQAWEQNMRGTREKGTLSEEPNQGDGLKYTCWRIRAQQVAQRMHDLKLFIMTLLFSATWCYATISTKEIMLHKCV